MKKLLIATGNAHKFQEICAVLENTEFECDNLKTAGISIDEPEENGTTFKANAEIKAKAYLMHYQGSVLADDSGIVVPVLNNEPGIYSARYAGLGASDEDNRQKLSAKLRESGLEKTPAYFVCSLCYIDKNQQSHFFESEWHGEVIVEPKGEQGFGYDPMFFLPEENCTAAELVAAEKNKISHRGQALDLLKAFFN